MHERRLSPVRLPRTHKGQGEAPDSFVEDECAPNERDENAERAPGPLGNAEANFLDSHDGADAIDDLRSPPYPPAILQ